MSKWFTKIDIVTIRRPKRIPVKNGMDDIELIEEFYNRKYNDKNFLVKVNCYEDYLDGKAASMWDEPLDLDNVPF